MAWTVKYLRSAKQGIKGITPSEQRKIKAKIEELAKCSDPASVGKKLKGKSFRDFYRVRVGDYRVIYRVENDELILVVIRIGHRSKIYK